MKTKENFNINELLGNLKKIAEIDQCTTARQQLKPTPCEFASIGKTVYCKIHGGLRINK